MQSVHHSHLTELSGHTIPRDMFMCLRYWQKHKQNFTLVIVSCNLTSNEDQSHFAKMQRGVHPLLNRPQRWSPYQLLHVLLAVVKIWAVKEGWEGEAYLCSCCSTWGLVKPGLQAGLRSSLKPIKLLQNLHEYIIYLLTPGAWTYLCLLDKWERLSLFRVLFNTTCQELGGKAWA